MIKLFQCHLSLFSDIKSLQGLLKVMAECDDKDISVPSISLYRHQIIARAVKVREECDDKDISVPSISL